MRFKNAELEMHERSDTILSVPTYEPTYELTEISRRKIVIIGDPKTGKTSIVRRFTEGSIPTEYTPTYFENSKKRVALKKEKIELNIFDAGGDKKFDNIRPLNYTGADLFIITFALDSKDSLQNVVKKWAPEISKLDGVPIILVGNKEDKRFDSTGKEFVSYKEGINARDTIKAVEYIECSAKKNIRIEEIFEFALQDDSEESLW